MEHKDKELGMEHKDKQPGMERKDKQHEQKPQPSKMPDDRKRLQDDRNREEVGRPVQLDETDEGQRPAQPAAGQQHGGSQEGGQKR